MIVFFSNNLSVYLYNGYYLKPTNDNYKNNITITIYNIFTNLIPVCVLRK